MKSQSKQKSVKFWTLCHPGGPRGIITKKPRRRKQDRRAKPLVLYAVVFFPKMTGLWDAMIMDRDIHTTLAATPETARARFMDAIAKKEKWETYVDAGWRIRQIKITDLGNA